MATQFPFLHTTNILYLAFNISGTLAGVEVVPSPPDELEEDPDGGNVTCADALDDDASNSTATALNATLDLASMVPVLDYLTSFCTLSVFPQI